MSDFEPIKSIDLPTAGGSAAAAGKGKKRNWLMAFETLPAQLLNVYGASKFPQLKDAEVWKHFNEEQKTGAVFMTEYCDKEVERQGIGLNRWLHAQMLYCKHQLQPGIKLQNEFVLNKTLVKELYDEIANILPALEYCLAPKKAGGKKAGAASLRAGGVSNSDQPLAPKTDTDLDKHGKSLYEWISKEQSRIRMLINYQGGGGLPFVASCHLRATRCYRFFGNSVHTPGSPEVTLSQFQAAIKARHACGNRGIEEEVVSNDKQDFAK